jgi:hypothetical protein
MYHRSRRSVSNPRGKKALGTTSRSTTPQPARGEQPSKPAWDVSISKSLLHGAQRSQRVFDRPGTSCLQDTYGDLSKYKLTPEQVVRM